MADTITESDETLNVQVAMLLGAQLIDYPWYDGRIRPFLWWPDMPPPRGDDFQQLSNGWLCEWNCLPEYDTTITAAWDLIEYLQERGYIVQLTSPNRLIAGIWRCAIDEPLQSDGQYRTFVREAETAPLAICRAALAVLKANAPAR